MQGLLPTFQRQALYRTGKCRALEAEAQSERPAHALMARAGQAVARLALAVAPQARSVWIACGPGNNGGDGLIAAKWLHQQGLRVHVSRIAAATTPTDAAWALAQAAQAGIAMGVEPPDFTPDLIIDALLGLGSSRAPAGAIAEHIDRINALPSPVLAVDLPTGLDGDCGRLLGDSAVRADHTLCLLSVKPGLLTGQGRAHAGTLWFDDLGVTPSLPPDAWLQGRDALQAVAAHAPGHDAHKGSQGDVLIVGGAAGMQGAARLAARSALAAGAGRVYACLIDEHAGPDPQRAELMQWPLARLQDAQTWRGHCLVVGCGGGTAIADLLPQILAEAARLVLDADALNAIAASAALREQLRARRAAGLASVLTPHPLEAARLLDCTAADVQADRLAAADALSQRYDCTVLLKGSGSVIASPGLTPLLNSSGSSALATAGTGDVLAGWLGGLWARHRAPGGDGSSLERLHALTGAAAYWHGLAGDEPDAGPMRASDLIERMHALHPLNRRTGPR